MPLLPQDPGALISFKIGNSPPLSLYCDADRIEGKRLMEVGCGCGNLGKYLGRYCESYLGTDYSTLALMVARLVSPGNCHYVHLSDHAALAAHFGTIDTIVGRYFWIHQNMALAGRVLRFMAPFLARDGRIYADFFWPNPEKNQGVVLSPNDELSESYASATFAYSREDVEMLIENMPIRVVREFVHADTQRRYVVLEKLN